MTRYQLVPWATGPSIDVTRAMRIGARRPAISHPIMAHIDAHNRMTGATWRGTNLPPVLVFSADSDAEAVAIRKAYGEDMCFVELRHTAERVD